MKSHLLPTLFVMALAFATPLSLLRAQNAPGTPLPPSNPLPPPTNAQAAPSQHTGNPGGPGKRPAFLPGKGEMEMREKLETLANLTPQQLDAELQKWPRYQQMDLGERAKLLQRIQEFKERRHKAAENKARELNLKLTPEQFQAFESKFWEKRNQADRQLWQEMEPRRKMLDQQINNELKVEYGAFVAPNSPAPTTAPAAPAKSAPMAPTTSATSGTMP